MKNLRKYTPMLRAVGVIGVVAGLATAVTFAALSSQATLTDNNMSTATASLKLWDGDSFESTAPGFSLTNVIPGTNTAPFNFYFQNDGGLNLNVTAHIPVAPSTTNVADFADIDVTISSAELGCGIPSVTTTMAALIAGEVALPCNSLTAGAQGNNQVGFETTEGNYSVVVNIDPTTVSGSQATVGNFNLVFTGTQAL